MQRRRMWIVTLAALAAALAWAAPAAALPPSPWTGEWLAGTDPITLSQSGSTITGTFASCGGGTYSGTVSADNRTWTGALSHAPGLPGCSSTGQATFTVTMAPDGRSFTGPGVTIGFGSPFTFSATYVSGGTEPRGLSRLSVRPARANESVGQSLRLTVARLDAAGKPIPPAPGGQEGFTYAVAGPNAGPPGAPPFVPFGADGQAAITLKGTALGTDTVAVSYLADPAAPPLTATASVTWLPPAPDLQGTIPSPRTVSAGPTTGTYPSRVSLRSLTRSRCVRVVAVSTRPARVLVTIFSGRRSLRLFGQKDVLFVRPGRKLVCITVPRRARTFNVRTPLRFALGYRLGTTPATLGPRNRPVIRPIRLAP